MIIHLPSETIATMVGNDIAFALLLAVAFCVPTCTNGYAAIPLVAGLIESGMLSSSVLAFMTAGAMTSVPATIASFAFVKRLVFLWYLMLITFGPLVLGLSFQFNIQSS